MFDNNCVTISARQAYMSTWIKEIRKMTNETKSSGKLSWKWIGVIAIVIIIIGGFLLMKVNPPIEITTVASNEDKTSAVIGVGNTGFSGIKIKEVTVNNGDNVPKAKLQVADVRKGFIFVDDFEQAEEGYKFVNLDEEYIKTGTTLAEVYNEDGEPEDVPNIYGVTIIHDEPIDTVEIEYSHFGISYTETVEVTH